MTYLMCVKDCFTKEWQEYHYSRSCMAGDAIRSVENAVLMAFNGSVSKGLVLRTDNGPRYISHEFRSAMKLLWIKLEYIQKHTPEDNGNIESFHNSLKTDYIWPNEFMDFHDASITIGKAFIDYLPPREFRNRFERKQVQVTSMRIEEKRSKLCWSRSVSRYYLLHSIINSTRHLTICI